VEDKRGAHLLGILEHHADVHPEKKVFIRLGKDASEIASLTFRGLDELSCSLAHSFQTAISEGDKVIMLYESAFDFIPAFLAMIRMGAIPIAIQTPNSSFRMDRLKRQMQFASVRKILVTNTIRQKSWFRKLMDQDDWFTQVTWIIDDRAIPIVRQSYPRIPVSVDGPMYMQLSSGSTGESKQIPISSENVVYNTTAMNDVIGLVQDDRVLSWLPHFHDLGLVGSLLFSIVNGTSTYLLEPMDFISRPQVFIEALSRHAIHFCNVPNFSLDLCVKRIDPTKLIGKLDLSNLKTLLVGAEPVREDSLTAFIKRFSVIGFDPRAILIAYGLAEYTLAVTMQASRTLFRSFKHPTTGKIFLSCGKPIRGTTISIASSAEDAEIEGEVVVCGPGISSIFEDGKLYTGDFGLIRNGELYIVGRKKEIIIINGVNYMLHEIEHLVETLPFVQERGSLAVSMPGQDTEKLQLFVELNRAAFEQADFAILARQINRKLITELGIGAEKTCIVGPATLPKTSSGKKQRSDIWQLIDEGKVNILYAG
jgi:acyl-CoA synthetase (AMP-forming)/AMP-acid ligase II